VVDLIILVVAVFQDALLQKLLSEKFLMEEERLVGLFCASYSI